MCVSVCVRARVCVRMHACGRVRACKRWGGVQLQLFAHSTSFLGKRVVLLGRFNGQGLGAAAEASIRTRVVTADGVEGATAVPEEGDAGGSVQARPDAVTMLVRVEPGVEYVKAVLRGGRVEGAMMIGGDGDEVGWNCCVWPDPRGGLGSAAHTCVGAPQAEAFENLIAGGLDVGPLGPRLLDPELNLADYFD